jgi:hypothetical protein
MGSLEIFHPAPTTPEQAEVWPKNIPEKQMKSVHSE